MLAVAWLSTHSFSYCGEWRFHTQRGKIDCNININIVYHLFWLNPKWLALCVVLCLPRPRCEPGSFDLLLGALIVTPCMYFRLWDKSKENSYIFQVHLPNSIWGNLRYKLSVLKDSIFFCSWYLCYFEKNRIWLERHLPFGLLINLFENNLLPSCRKTSEIYWIFL